MKDRSMSAEDMMRHNRAKKMALLASSACILTGGFALPSAAQTAAGAEEIFVSARKRDETLQEVPVAVQVFTATQIERANINRPEDFLAQTPNISIVNSVNVGEARVNIRGVQGPFDTEQSFALVVDGVLSANPNALNQELIDIEQIEVLKGPQSPLYGRNAIGGAIIINTKGPSEELTGRVSVEGTNGDGIKAVAMLSGPLGTDKLLGRVVAMHRELGGFFDSSGFDGTVDDYREQSVQARFMALPSDELSFDLRARFSRITAGAGYFNTQANPGLIGLGVLDPFVPPIDTDTVTREFRTNIDPLNIQERIDISLKAEYETPWAMLSGVFQFADLNEFFYADGALNPLVFDPATFLSFNPVPFPAFSELEADGTQNTQRDQRDYQFEFRVTSPADQSFRWIVGTYWADITRVSGQNTGLDLNNGRLERDILVTDLNSSNPTNSLLLGENDNKVLSFLGQLAYDILPNLELAVEFRWDREKRTNINLVPDILSPGSIILGAPVPLTQFPGLVREETFKDFQPRVSISYRPTDNINIYASYAQGFRSGGFNAAGSGDTVRAVDDPTSTLTDAFGAETSDAFEIGVKSSWLDNRLTANAALFYTDISNAHDFVFFPVSITRAIDILDEVRNMGFEADVSYRATDELTVSMAFGYIDTEIKADANNPQLVGNRTPETPEFSFTANIDYVTPVFGDYDFTGHLDYTLTGETYFDSANTPGTERGTFGLVNGRIAIGNDTWQAALFARNIFDKKYAVGTTVVSFLNYPFPAPPRTFGGSLSLNF